MWVCQPSPIIWSLHEGWWTSTPVASLFMECITPIPNFACAVVTLIGFHQIFQSYQVFFSSLTSHLHCTVSTPFTNDSLLSGSMWTYYIYFPTSAELIAVPPNKTQLTEASSVNWHLVALQSIDINFKGCLNITRGSLSDQRRVASCRYQCSGNWDVEAVVCQTFDGSSSHSLASQAIPRFLFLKQVWLNFCKMLCFNAVLAASWTRNPIILR